MSTLSDGWAITLRKKGILDSSTRINIQVLSPDATAGFFPLNTGVFSCIKTATMRIGTRVVQEIEDVAHLITHSRMTRTAEQRKQSYRARHGQECTAKGTPGYYACKILW